MPNEFVLNYPERAFAGLDLHSSTFSCRLRVHGSCLSSVWWVPSGTVDDIILALDRESAIKTASWLISMLLGQKEGGVLRITDGEEFMMVMFRVFSRHRKSTIVKEMEKIRIFHLNSPRKPFRPIRKDRLRFEVAKDDFKVRRNWLVATGDGCGLLRLALSLLINAQAGEHSKMVFGSARHQVPIDTDSCWLTINIPDDAVETN